MDSKVKQLHSRAESLVAKFEQGGETDYINEAIVFDREALELCPPGHPMRSDSLNRLAVHLGDRHRHFGAMVDLEEAIGLDRDALELRPQGHPDRSKSFNNLAVHLYDRYNRLGVMTDLDEAVVLDREALELRPPGHPGRSNTLDNLAIYFSTRHKQLGAMEDLDEAIVLDREALGLRPPGHPQSNYLNNLAVRLWERYQQLGAIEDLDEAIVLDRDALERYPPGHAHRAMTLGNLAVHLSDRYRRLGEMEDLDEVIVLDREALELRPPGHPHRSVSLSNLASHLSTRYWQLGEMEDLEEAIVLEREALPLRTPGHPDRSISLTNLARFLRIRLIQSSQLKYQEERFSLYTQLAHVLPQTVSSSDLSAAKEWVNAAEDHHHPPMLLAYETSLRLLIQHLATLPSLPRHLAVLKDLTASLAVDAFSACLRERAPARAVELLEQGRGVFWSQLTRLRSPLDDVIASGPAGKTLADEFTRLTSCIRDALDSPGANQHDRVCHFNLELQRVLTDIRDLPGLSCFLLPSLFSDLQQAARGGPVIIVNASQYSCDALVVLVDQDPVHIPLQITQGDVRELASKLHRLTVRAKRDDVKRELAAFLRKLWDEVVSRIVDFLKTIYPFKSRIWWCPTAEFSLLPLHAAGPFRKGQRKFTDLYISSYTPTLTALIHARRPSPPNSTTEGRHFVAVGQATAVRGSELVSVGAELTNIGQRVDGLATFTRVEGTESCISRVAEELRKNKWVHFACHGIPNRQEPFESAFALHDGHFTIQHIVQCNLENPQFAYLSACHTTVGDEESPDEVIHLASAMQFAGFRSVIGTMWAVDDGQTNKIISMFYDNMTDESGCLDHTRAALALHETMRKMVDVPLDQRILYIHLGA